MNKKIAFWAIVLIIVFALVIWLFISNREKKEEIEILSNELTATVVSVTDEALTLRDRNDIIYTFNDYESDEGLNIGEEITATYTGDLDKNTEKQTASIIKCAKIESDDINDMLEDKSVFSAFYKQAFNVLDDLSLKEKVGQVILAAAPEKNQADTLKDNPYSGYILYKRDFEGKNSSMVQNYIRAMQKASKIPLLIAVDEEGGTVVRVGTNSKLITNPFKSPKELYDAGGLTAIKQDVIDKSDILHNLGINVNLAPVVDVVTEPSAYMYSRALGQDTTVTSEYARTVIKNSKGTGVSYVLKHFPGYGNNADTHENRVTDETAYDEILNVNLPPFIAGTDTGAEAVLVSHNIVKNIDDNNPASLSASVHNLLRNRVGFSGIAITDDLSMKAITESDALVKALLAGNDLLIVTDPTNSINTIVEAVNDGVLDEKIVDKAALRVIAWKYYKGLFDTSTK